LLADLKISHTALFLPDAIEYPILLDAISGGEGIPDLIQRRYWGSYPSLESAGFFMARAENKWFVDGVLEGSPAAAAGLKYGDEIVAIDDAPPHPVLSFRGKSGRTAALQVRHVRDGTIELVLVPVLAIIPSRAFASATSASAKVIVRGNKRIGYMHVWSSKAEGDFNDALARLTPAEWGQPPGQPQQGASRSNPGSYRVLGRNSLTSTPLDGIIVDVRGKVGGSNFGRQFVEALGVGSNGPLGGKIEFQGREGQSGWNQTNKTTAPPNPPFKGRAVMLVDHHARSALELFAYSFQHEKMGPLIGTPTAGAVSAAQLFRAPYDALLYLAVSRIKADGQVLEGIGVLPDVAVDRPLPYANGADPVLDAALAHFDKQP
jgi:carboxyl-terminal processing protease